MKSKCMVILIAACAAGIAGCASEDPYASTYMASADYGVFGMYHDPVPPLDPARKIRVEDCTKPVSESGANLVCR